MPSVSGRLFSVYWCLIERSYRYSLHYRLRYGRIGETWTKIPNSVTVCAPYVLKELSLNARAFAESLETPALNAYRAHTRAHTQTIV
jgi:hypothetical protein